MTHAQTAFNDVMKAKSRSYGAKLIEIRLLPEDKRTPELQAEDSRSLTQQARRS